MKDSTLKAKEKVIKEIKDKIDKSQAIVLVDYRGLNVEQLTEFRSKCREAGVDYKVYKNTMMRFAFKEAGLEDFNGYLKGPNAVAFGYNDPVQVAKVTTEFAKVVKTLEIKAGVVDGKVISEKQVDALGNLPSKEVLLAQVVGTLNAPIQGFANVLNGPIRGLAVALRAIAEQKSA